MMSQEVEEHGTSKDDPKSSGKSLELVRLRETKVHHHHQSISRLVEDVRKVQIKVKKIRKYQEEARRMQAEQINQQKKLTEMIEQIQAAISVKTADDSMKIRLTSGRMLETSVLGIRCKKECPSSSFNDVDKIEGANMDGVDISSQFDQNDQGKEEEEIKKG